MQVKEAEEELARINKLEPMGDVDIDTPTVSTDYGDTIQKVASGEDYMVVSDGKADGSSPEKPLVVKLSFPGDLPAYGISYEDSEGKGEEHRFSICMSGKDGSLLMSDLDQE